MSWWESFKPSLCRVTVLVCGVLLIILAGYALWAPGLDIRDGRHDHGENGIWLSHGWLGANDWFIRNGKTNQFAAYRDRGHVQALAAQLRRHGITDVFPHLCPADKQGQVPSVDAPQTEQFRDEFAGFRVMPWIGGPNGSQVFPGNPKWRAAFIQSVQGLFVEHPRFAGVHLNVEPIPSGDADFLVLLDQLRAGLPKGKVLSVAAYPPPTRWQQFEEVHWAEDYFQQAARRCDQMAVMMYDTSLRVPKLYQRLISQWTEEVLIWGEGTQVLLGVPTYGDAGVGYHDPRVEN